MNEKKVLKHLVSRTEIYAWIILIYLVQDNIADVIDLRANAIGEFFLY